MPASSRSHPEARPVPFLDLVSVHNELLPEILEAWTAIVREARFAGGPVVQGFETEFADFCGTAHAIGVSNGTDALRLALIAMGVKPGDEVVTVPHTFIATTEAISQTGARPVFVDVDRETGTLDPTLLQAALTERTRAVVPVHLYGQPADMDPIRQSCQAAGIPILEDACQAHGAEYRGERVGSMGVAAAFSFYPGKNLGACGEAGCVTTNDPELAEKLTRLRDHGQSEKYVHVVEGFNARLDALQAAVLRIKLRRLEAWNEARRRIARAYDERLEGTNVVRPREAPGRKHVYHLYVIRHPERDRLRAALQDEGIHTGLHYPIPLHLQSAYSEMALGPGSFPESEAWASQCLSLPMYPEMGEEAIDRVTEAIRRHA